MRRATLSSRLPWLACLGVALPFFMVRLPPLVDAPGHLAQFAIQAAGPDSPLRAYYGFHWALRLNLGCDILVELLRRPLGLEPAFWLVSALLPVLTAAAILSLARAANPRGASATGWALLFCYASPLLFGLLNYVLAMALSLIGYALWRRLEGRPALREALFWIIIPALMVAHAIGGALLPVMIAASAAANALTRPRRQRLRPILVEIRPLLALLPILLLWRATGSSGALTIVFSLPGKGGALVAALRDQFRWLDIASMAAALMVPLVGRRIGARYTAENGAAAGALALLFLVCPSQLNGSFAADVRLVPAAAIALLVLQDWSGGPRRPKAIVAGAGWALFLLRLGITAWSFAGYARSFEAERAALPHIAPGARVIALVDHPCRASRAWRGARLDHIAALATAERAAWTNAMWDVPDIHLLTIRYRPSPLFYDDPSQYVWPADCLTPSDPQRRTIGQAMPLLPLGKIDYLWLIHTKLPPGPWTAALRPVWSSGRSSLYHTLSAAPAPSLR